MVEKEIVSKNQMITKMLHIGHGDYNIYLDVGTTAAKSESELFAHFLSWNTKNGEVRDSKVALPICALRGTCDKELFENAVANLCCLDPRNLWKAIKFNSDLTKMGNKVVPPAGTFLKDGVKQYLKVRESDKGWFDRTVLQHRESMHDLYAHFRVKPSSYAQSIIFDDEKPKGSVFEAVSLLKNMSPKEAAGTILNKRIPFLVAIRAIGKINQNSDVILALISSMSGNELITNTNSLKKMGVFENDILKSAYDEAMNKAKTDKRTSTLKAGKAAEAVGDKKIAKKLQSIQEDKLVKLGGIDGDWLVLGDKSGSMSESIEVAKQVSALIAQQVKGKVHLIFFNVSPAYFDVSGKTLEEIKSLTKRISAGGGTSIGCGVDYIMNKNVLVDGIVIVSDGGDNTSPRFVDSYKKYAEKFGIEPTVYHLHVPGEQNVLARLPFQIEKFELGRYVDYYSLPNIVKVLKANRYHLLDEIMGTPLLTFKDVFKAKEVTN